MATRFICKCECGGNVRGVKQFGQLFTWCTKCTPVVKINVAKLKKDIQAALHRSRSERA
jgi:hypothetical protein